jgi:hypothetical protein
MGNSQFSLQNKSLQKKMEFLELNLEEQIQEEVVLRKEEKLYLLQLLIHSIILIG